MQPRLDKGIVIVSVLARRVIRYWLPAFRGFLGLQAIGRGLERGLAPHQVVVCHQDLTRDLTALKSKRLHLETVLGGD